MWPRTRVGGFFCYKGGLKWPLRPLGVGGGELEQYLISPLLSGEAPPPSWAGGLGALPEAQNGGRAARPRGPAPRLTGLLGLGKEKHVLWGLSHGVWIKKGSSYGAPPPPQGGTSCVLGAAVRVGRTNLR